MHRKLHARVYPFVAALLSLAVVSMACSYPLASPPAALW